MSKPEPKPGDLRVWCIINPPREPIFYSPISDPVAALALIDSLADAQLKMPHIWGNVFGLHVFADGEWEEWEDENGYNVTDADAILAPVRNAPR